MNINVNVVESRYSKWMSNQLKQALFGPFFISLLNEAFEKLFDLMDAYSNQFGS